MSRQKQRFERNIKKKERSRRTYWCPYIMNKRRMARNRERDRNRENEKDKGRKKERGRERPGVIRERNRE